MKVLVISLLFATLAAVIYNTVMTIKMFFELLQHFMFGEKVDSKTLHKMIISTMVVITLVLATHILAVNGYLN